MKTPLLAIFLTLALPLGLAAQTTPAPAAPPALPDDSQLWNNLTKYHADNVQLEAAPAAGKRVIFFGDSITDAWHLDGSFPGKNYINRGISGQTTAQMLLRFQEDVIRLHPAVVLFLAGTNDIAQNQGPIPMQSTEDNLLSMAEICRANGAQPILCSVLPAFEYGWHPGLHPADKIPVLNKWIEAMCAKKHFAFLNYYPALVAPNGGMKPELSGDGVHPNPAGYALMAPLASAAIAKALHH
jgi:lysophospholipase L1-like esterase